MLGFAQPMVSERPLQFPPSMALKDSFSLPYPPKGNFLLFLLPWNSSPFQGLWLPLANLGPIFVLPQLWLVLPSGAHLCISSHSPNLVHFYPENGGSFSHQKLFPMYQTTQCHNTEDHNMSFHHCEFYVSLSEQHTSPPRCCIMLNSKLLLSFIQGLWTARP